jgi:hypothetical protein
MYDRTYWHGYLMARHHLSLVMGIVLMVVALLSMLSGSTLVKGRGIVSRADDPKTFRNSIILNCVLGLIFLGLYWYTAN